MSKLNTPWSLDADAVRDNTGRIVVETINCGETFAEEIVKCVNGYADLEAEIKQADSDVEHNGRLADERQKRIAELEAELENCVLAKRQAENEVARFTAEGSNLRKRISELEARVAEAEALNEQQAEAIQEYRDRQMEKDYAECLTERDALKAQLTSAVPFEDVESAYREGYKDGFRDADFDPYNRALLGYEGAEEVGWEHSDAKTRLDERRKGKDV